MSIQKKNVLKAYLILSLINLIKKEKSAAVAVIPQLV